MLKLSPSILSADFLKLGEEIEAVEKAGCKYIHVDVMDGLFVPSISFGMPILSAVRKKTDKFLDVHLMIEKPERYIEEFIKCGADLITVHAEACECLEKTIDQIHALGKKAGVSINPETSEAEIIPFLEKLDLVLVMTVHPGFGGQKYMEACTAKIEKLHQIRKEKGYLFDLEVDGGINKENFEHILEAGANVIVAGSAIFGPTTQANAEYFMQIMNKREKETNR